MYLLNNSWQISVALPSILAGINLGNVSQVELDFTGNSPYRSNQVHIAKYKKEKKYKEENHKKINPNTNIKLFVRFNITKRIFFVI